MQEPAAWKIWLFSSFPVFTFICRKQGFRGCLSVNGAFIESDVLTLILNQAERCAWNSRVHVGISGVQCQSEQVLRYFYLLGIVCDLFSFSLQQHCLCTQVPGNGACPSRYLSAKCASSHPCHTWQNTIYSISPSLIYEPDYIREVMNNEQENKLSQQRKYLRVLYIFNFQEIKNLDWS